MFSDVLLKNPVVINSAEKKKPHNVQIKNFNPKEPKVKQSIKYSAKQSYRRYKTIKEPYLHSKIMVDDGDDMVSKIQEAFGIKPKAKPNYTDSQTHANPHNAGLDYMPPSEGTNDDFIERILYEIAKTGRNKIDNREMTKDDAQTWAENVLKKHNISEADVNRVGTKVDKKLHAEFERKIQSAHDRINKEGSHVLKDLDPEEYGGEYSSHWAQITDTASRKESKEAEKAELFEGIARDIISDIINQALDTASSPIDLSKKPEDGEEGRLYDDEDDDEDVLFDEHEPTEISAKTTEVGSVALETERTEALKRSRGRPKSQATIDREKKKAEEAEQRRLANELKEATEKEADRVSKVNAFYETKRKNAKKNENFLSLRGGYNEMFLNKGNIWL